MRPGLHDYEKGTNPIGVCMMWGCYPPGGVEMIRTLPRGVRTLPRGAGGTSSQRRGVGGG